MKEILAIIIVAGAVIWVASWGFYGTPATTAQDMGPPKMMEFCAEVKLTIAARDGKTEFDSSKFAFLVVAPNGEELAYCAVVPRVQ